MEFDRLDISMESKSFHYGSPISIHVVTVDSDNQMSLDLQNMLNSFGYQVTKCDQGEEALVLLRTNKQKYNIVITSDYLPGNISGFDLLTAVSSELRLPIIMVSSDNRTETKLKAILHGCCEYIVKPVKSESLKSIWEHVIRNKKKLNDFELNLQGRAQNITNYNSNNSLYNIIDADIPKDITVINNNINNYNLSGRVNEELVHEGEELEKGLKILERGIGSENGIFEDERRSNDMYSTSHVAKKSRLVWSENLHRDFLSAIASLDHQNVVPKKILEIMRSKGYKNITRENVASHLQKHRDSNKKCKKPEKTYLHGVDAGQDRILLPEINNNNNNNNNYNYCGVQLPNIINNHGYNNNNYITEVKVMSYQNSSQQLLYDQVHIENGKSDYDNNESLSFWRSIDFENLKADHGMTLNDLELLSNLLHEDSDQPHQARCMLHGSA